MKPIVAHPALLGLGLPELIIILVGLSLSVALVVFIVWLVKRISQRDADTPKD
jgi:flagellar biogenesis protein FliO